MTTDHQKILEDINSLMQAGQPQKIIELIDSYFQDFNKTAELLSKLATAHIMMGKRGEAACFYNEALDIDSNYVPALANLSLMHLEAGEFLTAKSLAEKAYVIDKTNIPLYSTYASILRHLGLYDEAIQILKQGLKQSPENIEMCLNLAGLLAENDQKSEAFNLLEKVLVKQPNNARALMMHASIHKFKKDDLNLERIQDALISYEEDSAKASDIHFALGKAYEDCKNFQKSFYHYKKANDIFRQSYVYYIENDKRYLDGIVKKTQHIKPVQSNDLYKPIFIIGMPRSGTSLIEQILASHSAVNAMGEQATIEKLYNQYSEVNFSGLENAQKYYLDNIQYRISRERVFTDKMPLNFRYIGFIKALFPNAKFIHCKRDPIDTCLSIYKKKFVGIIPFAQNFKELAEYYKLYESQMYKWQKIFSNDILEMPYQVLIDDTQKEVRKLLTFCDLDWEEQCLEFYNNKRAVTTASSQQVRKPIYKDAINYWKNYELWLNDLISEFK